MMVSILLSLTLFQGVAMAQSSITFSEVSGAYAVKGTIDRPIPRDGHTRVSFSVVGSDSLSPIIGATAKVVARGDGASEVAVWALDTPQRPGQFTTIINLEPGDWALAIELDGNLGDESIDLPNVTVEKISRPMSSTIIFFSTMLLLIVGVAYFAWNIQRRQKERPNV